MKKEQALIITSDSKKELEKIEKKRESLVRDHEMFSEQLSELNPSKKRNEAIVAGGVAVISVVSVAVINSNPIATLFFILFVISVITAGLFAAEAGNEKQATKRLKNEISDKQAGIKKLNDEAKEAKYQLYEKMFGGEID